MNIEQIILQLRAEQKRLDGIIATLESLTEEQAKRTPRKRGRKFMDGKSRAAVSERMKRYWKEKNEAAAGGEEKAERASSGAA